MRKRTLPHLRNSRLPETEAFAPIPGGGKGIRIPFEGDKSAHGRRLKLEYQEAMSQLETDEGTGLNLTFTSFPGMELMVKGLENQGQGEQPQLRSIIPQLTENGIVQQATVFVPFGKVQYFISKVDQYLSTLHNESARNYSLLEVIERIRRTTIDQLWSDPLDQFPADRSQKIWWEVWLWHHDRDNGELRRLIAYANEHRFELSRHFLGFGNRSVALLHVSADELAMTFEYLDDIVELRRPAEVVSDILDLSPADQRDWAKDLETRLRPASENAPAVCILDSGVQPDHGLLTASLSSSDIFAADSEWDVVPSSGHATKMAGLALFGDLYAAMASNEDVVLTHRLESVKILSLTPNERELYGAITAKGVDQPEIGRPRRSRVFMLATTAPRNDEQSLDGTKLPPAFLGRPTIWSATLDALAFGRTIDNTQANLVYLDRDETTFPRLFVVSAGNIESKEFSTGLSHLDLSDNRAVEDPAQAWNVLTVGALAHKDQMDGAHPDFVGYVPVAPRGELAPVSRTSVPIDRRKWPFKPEVVAPGGNHALSADGVIFDTPDSLSLLTTRFHKPGMASLTATGDTSAAAAQVAGLAAEIQARYPDYRPETIRGLIVHSAVWTPVMRQRFSTAELSDAPKSDLVALLRRYGMGVPDSDRALRSAEDALTLVTESTIHPFRFEPNSSDAKEGKSNELNLHRLPWPTEQLEALGATQVQMRITLSYFIEPNPSNRGWDGRYAYPSHGLRFAMKRPEDSEADFRKRINARARADKKDRPIDLETESEWLFGFKQQHAAGSLHTDIWNGSAISLASKGAIAIYPVSGWWKFRKRLDQSQRGAPYSLIVSIESPEVEVDLWTAVATQIEAETVIEV